MLIKYKEERDAGGELSAVAASAELLFELGLVEYDAHGDVVDGFRMRKARGALTTQRAVGGLTIENIVVASLNFVLSDDKLKERVEGIVVPHCFWGGYSVAAADMPALGSFRGRGTGKSSVSRSGHHFEQIIISPTACV